MALYVKIRKIGKKMDHKTLVSLVEKYRDLEISKNEFDKLINSLPFGKRESILTRDHVIRMLEAFIKKEITEEDITDWIDVMCWLDWFKCDKEGEAAICSVISELDMLEDIPDSRTEHLSVDEARYYIDALKNNKDISRAPYKKIRS